MGAAYAGFQRQPGKETVQATLEDALSRVTQEDIHVIGSGRTDAGAHALSQVVAFSTASSLPPFVLQRAANALLPRSIAITEARDAAPAFHPRFDARSRLYRYLIWNRPVRSPFWEGRSMHVKPWLDVEAMDGALRQLVGRHDFSSFVPANFDGPRERTVCATRCRREGPLVSIEIEAEGFMRQMVRSLAGTLIEVGRGRIDGADFARIVRACDRTQAGRTAPACGLYLAAVRYDEAESPKDMQFYPADAVSAGIAVSPEEKE